MGTPKGYTTKDKIEDFLNISITGEVDDYILAAEDIIDRLTGRNFVAGTVAKVRIYNGDETQELLIDDCVEITKVERGDDEWGDDFTEITAGGSDGYFLEPVNNKDENNLVIKPYRKIILRSKVWIGGVQNAKITAKWGYSTSAPEDISFAATVFASGMYNAKRGGSGDIKSEHIGGYMVTYDVNEDGVSYGDIQRAMTILDSYKKFSLGEI